MHGRDYIGPPMPPGAITSVERVWRQGEKIVEMCGDWRWGGGGGGGSKVGPRMIHTSN